MRRCKTTVITTTLAALVGSAAMSGTPIVYPAKNQTAEQHTVQVDFAHTTPFPATGIRRF